MSFDNVENELGTIVNFAQNCDENGYSLVSVQPWYPDAVIFSERHGRELFAEFEYTSSSFLQHRHDIRKCDVLICWIQDEQVGLPTIVLSEGAWHIGELSSEIVKENAYLKRENILLRQSLSKLSSDPVFKSVRKSASKPREKTVEHLDCKSPVTLAALKYIFESSRGFRALSMETDVSHTTVANFVRRLERDKTDEELADMYAEALDFAALDDTET